MVLLQTGISNFAMLVGYHYGIHPNFPDLENCSRMPRRNWRAPTIDALAKHTAIYPCPATCPAHPLIMQMFGVLTYDLVDEFRVNSRIAVPLGSQMVNGRQMRDVITTFLGHIKEAIQTSRLSEWPSVEAEYNRNSGAFIGLALGCLADLCFNLEYVRRITDRRWAYCNKHGKPRAFYPYLGVCPECIVTVVRPQQAALGAGSADATEEETEDRARYFGNKIQSHHVGRIGERVLSFILDLISKSHDPEAITGLIFDDQHDVDTVFFFDNVATLAQIKASPLILLPVVVDLTAPLTSGTSEETGLPIERASHTFTDLPTASSDLALYISLTKKTIPLGPKSGLNWPYDTFRAGFSLETAMDILSNWLTIYRSFEIPKQGRTGETIKTAWLTSGWGSPIDDNKTKAGLARSDNMMKGTYACLKYGAYYVQECARRTVRTALIANIDPAHQYLEYLQKLEDIRWGHNADFTRLDPETPTDPPREIIDSANLTYLFDSVFTFNRQILNDPSVRDAWNLEEFIAKLGSGALDKLLADWQQLSEQATAERLVD